MFFIDNGSNYLWSNWSLWFICIKFCGGGFCVRICDCVDNFIRKNGNECDGVNNDVINCNMYLCKGMVY